MPASSLSQSSSSNRPSAVPQHLNNSALSTRAVNPGTTSRLSFGEQSSAVVDSSRDYLLSESPFAAIAPRDNPRLLKAAADVYTNDQANRCNSLLTEAMESGQGVFQFVSPAAHKRQPSKDIPIADYLIDQFLDRNSGDQSLAKPLRPIMIGDFKVEDILPADKNDPACKTYTVRYTHPTYGQREMQITQVGISYKDQYFDASKLEQIHSYYEDHQNTQKGLAGQSTQQDLTAVCAPTLVSFGGFGRNAALLSCIEGLAQIKNGSVPLTEHGLSQLVEHIRVKGRESHDPRFLHNKTQFSEVVKFLEKQQVALQHSMNEEGLSGASRRPASSTPSEAPDSAFGYSIPALSEHSSADFGDLLGVPEFLDPSNTPASTAALSSVSSTADLLDKIPFELVQLPRSTSMPSVSVGDQSFVGSQVFSRRGSLDAQLVSRQGSSPQAPADLRAIIGTSSHFENADLLGLAEFLDPSMTLTPPAALSNASSTSSIHLLDMNHPDLEQLAWSDGLDSQPTPAVRGNLSLSELYEGYDDEGSVYAFSDDEEPITADERGSVINRTDSDGAASLSRSASMTAIPTHNESFVSGRVLSRQGSVDAQLDRLPTQRSFPQPAGNLSASTEKSLPAPLSFGSASVSNTSVTDEPVSRHQMDDSQEGVYADSPKNSSLDAWLTHFSPASERFKQLQPQVADSVIDRPEPPIPTSHAIDIDTDSVGFLKENSPQHPHPWIEAIFKGQEIPKDPRVIEEIWKQAVGKS